MQELRLSDAAIIEALTGNDPEQRKVVLHRLFSDSTLRERAIAHVRKYGGNRQDGEDVFQESIIIFDRKLRLGAYRKEGSVEAFFFGIVRWYWFNEQQRNANILQETPPEPLPGGDPELEYLLTERREQIEKLLDQLTEKCRKLLKMYQLDYAMEEIARLMGFANSGVAKKEAFLCRKRFKVLLSKHPEFFTSSKPD